jgi:PIN domain nuclease of toxin-antitoxin system
MLDSHVVVWWLADDRRLAASARSAIIEAADVFVSVVTPWELGIKQAAGKLELPDDLIEQIEATGFDMLAIQPDHATAAPRLPPLHADPFDRMLIAQAHAEQLTVVTADRRFDQYDIDVLPA